MWANWNPEQFKQIWILWESMSKSASVINQYDDIPLLNQIHSGWLNMAGIELLWIKMQMDRRRHSSNLKHPKDRQKRKQNWFTWRSSLQTSLCTYVI